MTSPGVGKPDNTFRNNNGGSYQQTHSKGSGFGQDLTEGRVRELLTNKVASPFAKAASGFTLAMGQVVTGIAEAIAGGGGASYSEVRGAMDSRIAPINNAITKAGERVTELGNQVSEIDRNQRTLSEEQVKALEDVESATDRVRELISERAELDRQLREDVDNALNAADAASASAGQAASQLEELNKDLSGKITSAVSANEDIKSAVEQAQQAVKAVGTRYEIGASLIPVDPFTRQPEWASAATVQDDGVIMVPAGTNHRFEDPTPVKLLENTTYRLKFDTSGKSGGKAEFRLSTPANAGTDTWVEFEWADNPRFENAIRRKHLALAGGGESYIRFPSDVSEVVINRLYNVGKGYANVSVFELAPLIPDQAEIDRLQDEAIMKNEKVGSSNATAIDILLDAQQTQQLVNEKQGEWNEASDKATRANTAAVRLLNRPDEGDNLIRYLPVSEDELGDPSAEVELDRPAWAVDEVFNRSTTTPSDAGLSHMWYAGDAKIEVQVPKVAGAVNPGQKAYKLTLWAAASQGDPCMMSIKVRSSATDQPIKSAKLIHTVDEAGVRQYNIRDMKESTGEWLVKNLQLRWSWKKFEIEVLLKPDVTDLWVDTLTVLPTGLNTGAIWVSEMKLLPDVPTQADVDLAQTKAIESLSEASRLSQEFEAEQMRMNRLVQNQIWTHQDMIELLDIRTPKVWGWKAYAAHEKNVTPPFSGFKQTDYRQVNHQFITTWENSNNFLVATRGRWTGWMVVSLNWTNGVIDRWVVQVTDENRAWNFISTPLHIDHRAWEVVMYPESLNREATVTLKKGNQPHAVGMTGDNSRPDYYFVSRSDSEGLVRDYSIRNIRLKNTVVCDKDVFYRDENNKRRKITRGRPIVGVELYPEDQEWFTSSASEVVAKFTEVNDKTAAGINYSVPNTLPSRVTSMDAGWSLT